MTTVRISSVEGSAALRRCGSRVRVAGLREHVQVLAGGHLGAHRLQVRTTAPEFRGAEAGAAEHLLRPDEQQVAEQDGPGAAELLGVAAPAAVAVVGLELAVGGRQSPPGVGGVHHVVVHERRHVQHVQRRGGPHHGVRQVVGAGDRGVRPRAERGAQALAAVGEDAGAFEQGRQVAGWSRRESVSALASRNAVDRARHRGAEVGGDGVGGNEADHAASLPGALGGA